MKAAVWQKFSFVPYALAPLKVLTVHLGGESSRLIRSVLVNWRLVFISFLKCLHRKISIIPLYNF
jgi:hypothetical protein